MLLSFDLCRFFVGLNTEIACDIIQNERYHEAKKRFAFCPVFPENFHPRKEECLMENSAKGYYNDSEKTIAIQQGMSQTQTIKTLIHEMMHQKLHAKEAQDPGHPTDRRTKEVEAESIAYTICQHYGLDSSDYSFSYVAGWSSGKEVKELKASLERIRSAADEMITGIDKALEKQAKREQSRVSRDEAR